MASQILGYRNGLALGPYPRSASERLQDTRKGVADVGPFMFQNKTIIGSVITLVLVIGGLFYWFEYRPKQIVKECSKKAMEMAQEAKFSNMNNFERAYDFAYEYCLKQKGL